MCDIEDSGKRRSDDAPDIQPKRQFPRVQSAAPAQSIQAFSPDLLRVYYDRLFPYPEFCEWLGYRSRPYDTFPEDSKNEAFLFRRELSFTLPGDIYIRYLCFKGPAELKEKMMSQQPEKIDIGAVFTIPPKNHNTVNKEQGFRPVQRELVFDIDMDEYDDIRTCCTGANVCRKCWGFMAAAIRCLDAALREDFGFKHILFIFSGRRGVHCWVCDDEARKLPNDQRTAVAEYLTLISGSAQAEKRVVLAQKGCDEIHPSASRAARLCAEVFEASGGLLEQQDFFNPKLSKCQLSKACKQLPQQAVTQLETHLASNPGQSSRDVWAFIKSAVKAVTSGKENSRPNAREQKCWAAEELLIELSYPRLDIGVSKQMNHLLKAPFCVHPKTGRVCVPIDPSRVADFFPMEVPTVGSLAAELDGFEGAAVNDMSKTSLQPYMDFFLEKFLRPMQQDLISGESLAKAADLSW
mmetsp:Transcript_41224/g.89862  ORF Transcript_41224/g.89862 Transcript_41224/m.89862 type:complete len:465 (+) Transcript_41224:24-1418(+)|eukprot:CAMPEP_0204269096 /NCGR_PEP_ID=MMETSP0468-20130131/15580_1 /ASSEMBLY_ACC=CAM_ASM_000383 /TAXON_ID=2969 /ORGANISM="Oxyrrhis marina" /LENGTH=464 /DNA_ID=CAMNT_0051244443 /DNA_START=23 /DNA_END=1417 /DNA_ORIENTATION=+